MDLELARAESPLGELRLAVGPRGLCALDFADHWEGAERSLSKRFGNVTWTDVGGTERIAGLLRAYFAGETDALEGIPVDPGGTPFQRRVWEELRCIRAGQTISYGELASRIGRPTATRAVALANARNPVPLVIPCHRVIGADGSLTGYGGGLERKRWLLEHEGALLRIPAPLPGPSRGAPHSGL